VIGIFLLAAAFFQPTPEPPPRRTSQPLVLGPLTPAHGYSATHAALRNCRATPTNLMADTVCELRDQTLVGFPVAAAQIGLRYGYVSYFTIDVTRDHRTVTEWVRRQFGFDRRPYVEQGEFWHFARAHVVLGPLPNGGTRLFGVYYFPLPQDPPRQGQRR
jgi:hypothetical protein